MSALRAAVGVALCVILVACANPAPAAPPDTRVSDEAAIRATDAAWSKVVEQKLLDQHVAFYTDDAVALPPNQAVISGKAAIRKAVEGYFAIPGFKMSWTTASVEVARSGDLAYTRGAYEMSFNDEKGQPVNDHGKYLEVWRKQADGSWKCAVDMFSSDMPAK